MVRVRVKVRAGLGAGPPVEGGHLGERIEVDERAVVIAAAVVVVIVVVGVVPMGRVSP
jgi:hypothetical protein